MALRVNSLNIRKMFSKEELKKIARSDHTGVARVIGKVTSVKEDKGQFGEYWNLFGTFEGTNMQTGEIVSSPVKCNLPGIAESEVVAAFKAANPKTKDGDMGKVIGFAYDICVIPNDKPESVGYEFAAASMMNEAQDPLADIKKSLPNLKIPALKAPEKKEPAKGEK